MDIVFLDANVLFSSAYLPESDFLKLWELPDVHLVSSDYAAQEARRNLRGADRLERLETLLQSVRLIGTTPDRRLPEAIVLPAKDAPILLAAVAANATHLLTGDLKHFGPYRNTVVEGVLILSTTAYFLTRPL
jgi:predicted nucleic acid-binding protein